MRTFLRQSSSLFLLLISLNSFCQEKDFYPADYKSIKAVSLTGGLIGFGFGGEVRADISVGNFLIFGSAGYKGYGARDSSLKLGSRTYQRIILSDCKGPIFKFGVGIRIHRSENSTTEFVASDMWMTEDAFNYYIHSRGNYANFPQLKSTYLMLEVSSLPTGTFFLAPYGFGPGRALFIPANNVYVSPRFRFMKEIAPLNRTTIIDFGPIICTDVKQAGLILNMILINRHFNYSMGFGLLRRSDKPNNFDDPFDGDGSYKWVFPFHFTFGGSFHRTRRYSDFSHSTSKP
jgi:hypothetical protein